MAITAPASEYSVTLDDAVALSGYSERHLRRLVDAGRLPAAKLRGKLLFTHENIHALTVPQPVEPDADKIIADLVANAPRFSEAQRSRIAAVLASAEEVRC